jgi:predicted RNA-binding protein with TRAM domain
MKKDDMLEITIEDISSDGSGVGKADGFALFVKDTIPGDQVKVKIMALVGGEITTSAWVDIENLTRQVICDIGYKHSEMGFDGNSCAVTGPHPGTVSGCQTVRRMSDPADVL